MSDPGASSAASNRPSPAAQTVHQMKLRAFDLGERTARRGRASLASRLGRWRSRWFLMVQTAITAGFAWFLAERVLGHRMPFFAPVAAIVTLGMTYGQRLRRGVEVAIGVAVGVFTGDLFVLLFGTGIWQIMVVIVLAASIATLLGAGQLMINQACAQSVIVITLAPGTSYAFDRWLDAVIGAALALLVATIAPSGPIRRPRVLAAEVLEQVAGTLAAAAVALREGDQAHADEVLERARAGESVLDRFSTAADEGLSVARYSPFRRHQLPGVQAFAELYDPLDYANRNLRVLARRCAVAVWREERVPPVYAELMEQLADVVGFMAAELHARRLPTAARDRLVAVAERSAHVELASSISAVVILAQVRSMTADLLRLTGIDYAEARQLIPEVA